jgi:hypothetical protein
MELSARLGGMMPYRKAAEVLAEFLPIEPTEGHQTVRTRTLTLGARLEEQSLRRERESPPLACERTQLEFMLDDPMDVENGKRRANNRSESVLRGR